MKKFYSRLLVLPMVFALVFSVPLSAFAFTELWEFDGSSAYAESNSALINADRPTANLVPTGNLGTGVQIHSDSTGPVKMEVAVQVDKFVAVYTDWDSGVYKARVGTISGSNEETITLSTSSYQFDGAGAVTETLGVAFLDGTRFIVAYIDDADSSNAKAVVGTISGSGASASISFGTEVTFATAAGTDGIVVSPSYDADKVILAWTEDSGNTSTGHARVASVSGTTITYGTAAEYGDGAKVLGHDVVGTNSTEAVALFANNLNSNYVSAVSGSISGTTITWDDTPYVMDSTSPDFFSIDVSPDLEGDFMVAFGDSGQDDVEVFYGRSDPITAEVNFGPEFDIETAGTAGPDIAWDDFSHFGVVYSDAGNSDRVTLRQGKVDDNHDITTAYNEIVVDTETAIEYVAVDSFDEDHFLVLYSKSSSPYTLNAKMVYNSYSTADPYVTVGDKRVPSGLNSWAGFSAEDTQGGTGTTYYQLSDDDGSTWKFWGGSSWDAVSGATDYNTASVVDTNISSFPVTANGLRWRAFIDSTGSGTKYIDSVTAEYDTSTCPSGVSNSGNTPSCLAADNLAPAFTVDTDDSSIHESTPVNSGTGTVTFTATATDSNGDDYYLIVCADGDTVTSNNEAAPSCSGTQICVSGQTNSASQASCVSATISTAAEEVQWESFICDHNTNSKCSQPNSIKSPYYVNHKPTFSSVTETDTGAGTIEPGDTVRFSASITDGDDVGSVDAVSMYICANGDTYSSGCSGTEICSNTNQAPGTITCDANASLTDVPTANGTYSYEIFVVDEHGFQATESSDHSYDVQDVAPQIISFTMTGDGSGDFDLTAGTTTNFVWTASVTDGNGDNDVTSASGKLYDDLATGAFGEGTSACNAATGTNGNAQLECYEDTSCTLSDVSTPTGAGTKTELGTDSGLTINCDVDVQFNARPDVGPDGAVGGGDDATWRVSASVIDGLGTVTDDSSSVGPTTEVFSALTAIDIRDVVDATNADIAYGSIAPGADTVTLNKDVYIANVGNVLFDTNLSGSDMCTNWGTAYTSCNGQSIAVANQEFSTSASAVNYGSGTDLAATNACINTSDGSGITAGVRTIVTTDTNVRVRFGIGLPAGTGAGVYTGQNTFSTTATSTCS